MRMGWAQSILRKEISGGRATYYIKNVDSTLCAHNRVGCHESENFDPILEMTLFKQKNARTAKSKAQQTGQNRIGCPKTQNHMIKTNNPSKI